MRRPSQRKDTELGGTYRIEGEVEVVFKKRETWSVRTGQVDQANRRPQSSDEVHRDEWDRRFLH